MAGILNAAAADGAFTPRGTGLPSTRFPPLRDEIILEPAGRLRGGAPSWTLYDPTANRFYRIGWFEFEVLCRWHLGNANEIASRIAHDTTLRPTADEVEGFFRFLLNVNLLRDATPEMTARLVQRNNSGRQGWFSWLVHHYLFIRIPLVRPDRLLEWLLPRLRCLYSYQFLAVTIIAGLTGLYLALRQWDTFRASFPWFFSLEGAALAGAALVMSKLLHELGHGLTAKRYGCRVPSMGVALLVLAPVLYTDTSEAWRLRKRSQRLAIGAAGMAAECCLAAYALLLWSFLPDGVLRSVVFVWATTAWVLTVLINMSPFMRFDGYYLLSDLIDVPNLQERSFALARHRLRELLFDFGEPPPEPWSAQMRRLLLSYAFSTWVYRFFLFLGIALVVYHMFFKALGILLFAVELWWFIGRPVARELAGWLKERRSRALNARTIVTIFIFAGILAIAVLPLRTSVHAPALLTSATQVQLFSHTSARVAAIKVELGDSVTAGEPVIELASPEIAYKLELAKLRVDNLLVQIRTAAQDSSLRSEAQLLQEQLEGAKAELAAALVEHERLTVVATVPGTLLQLAEPLSAGEWVRAGEFLGMIANTSSSQIYAYVAESDVRRIEIGGAAAFIPSDLARSQVDARIVGLDGAAVESLSDAELASVHGGPIATRQGENRALIPEMSLYRVTLESVEAAAVQHVTLGTAVIEGRPTSMAAQVWEKIFSVVVRESGF